MKRYITSLFCLLVISLPCLRAAADGPARVLIGGRELFSTPGAVRSEGEVYVSPTLLEKLGASYSSVDDSSSVSVSANGRTTEVTGKLFANDLMLPASKVAEALDATSQWDESAGAVRLTAKLKSIEFVDGQLKINSTLPVASAIKEWKDAGKVIIDIFGAKLDTEAREVFIGASDVQRARLGQFAADTARVVVDMSRSVRYRKTSAPIASQVVIAFGTNVSPIAPSTANPAQEAQSEQSVQPGALTGINVEPVNDNKALITLSVTGKVGSQTSFTDEPLSLVVDLLNTQLAMPRDEIQVSHPLIRSIRLEDGPAGFRVRVILNTSRYVAYDVDSSEGRITVSVALPQSAGGKLAGKTIVVDPGHGGRQTGTRQGDCLEKNINLQIAKRVHRMLVEEGVNAVLTRDGDHSIVSDLLTDLKARPALADKHGADMFVSVHCNSGGSSANGTETYYHLSAQSGRALAQSVQAHVIRETGMHNRKARSDGSVYPGKGFAVLRYANVPAILVETGYLSNSSDRSNLCDPDFQEKMARGIVQGIKAYVEGTP